MGPLPLQAVSVTADEIPMKLYPESSQIFNLKSQNLWEDDSVKVWDVS